MKIIKFVPKLGKPDPTEITNPAVLLHQADELDGRVLADHLRAGTETLDTLGRKQLIAVSRFLGSTEDDTRGKPVKAMREMVTAQLASEGETVAEAQITPPSVVRPITKLGGPVRAIRKLGT